MISAGHRWAEQGAAVPPQGNSTRGKPALRGQQPKKWRLKKLRDHVKDVHLLEEVTVWLREQQEDPEDTMAARPTFAEVYAMRTDKALEGFAVVEGDSMSTYKAFMAAIEEAARVTLGVARAPHRKSRAMPAWVDEEMWDCVSNRRKAHGKLRQAVNSNQSAGEIKALWEVKRSLDLQSRKLAQEKKDASFDAPQ